MLICLSYHELFIKNALFLHVIVASVLYTHMCTYLREAFSCKDVKREELDWRT